MASVKEKDTAETLVSAAEPERVPLRVPKGAANDDPNLVIGINGVNYVLPRGKVSMVPPEVKEEFDRSERAQEMLDERIDALSETAQK